MTNYYPTLTQSYKSVGGYTQNVGVAVPTASVSKWELVLLGAWIASFTVGLDAVFDLKLFDIIGAITIWRYRSIVLCGFKEKSKTGVTLRWVSIMFSIGFFIAILRVGEPIFVAIVLLRLARLFSYFSALLIFRALPFNARQLRIVIWIFCGSCLAQAILILLQEQGLVPLFWSIAEMAIYGRIYSTGTLGLNHLNQVLFMVVGLCATLSLVFTGRVRRSLRLVIVGVGCPMMLFAMLVGEARSGLVALAVMSSIIAIRMKKLILIVLIIPLSIVIDASLGLDIQARISNMWEQKFTQRMVPGLPGAETIEALDAPRPLIWRKSVNRLVEDPIILLVGAGFQNYKGLGAGGVAAGHNLYLHVLVELGIMGIASFLAFLMVLYRSLKSGKHDSADSSRIKMFGLTLFITLLVLGLFNESLYPQRAIMGFMGFALAYIAVAGHRGWTIQPYQRVGIH